MAASWKFTIGPRVVVTDVDGQTTESTLKLLTDQDVGAAGGVAGLDEDGQISAKILDNVGLAPYLNGNSWTSLSEFLAQLQKSTAGASSVPVQVVTNPGATMTVAFDPDGALNTPYVITPNEDLTINISGGKANALQTLSIIFVQPSSAGYRITLPPGTSVSWPGGYVPVVDNTPSAITPISITSYSGTYVGGA